MFWPAKPAGPNAPQRGRKNHHGQKEENAHHFKPQNSAHAAKGPQKPAHAARNSAGGRAGGSAGILAGRASLGCDIRSSATRSRRTLRTGNCMPARNSPRNAQADAQGAADGVWFHSVYDVSSTVAARFSTPAVAFTVAPMRRRT